MNLENGTIINQHTIVSAIGKGGMGEVFLAQDTKLEPQSRHQIPERAVRQGCR
jgi:serine/threonine protein kinase